MAGCFVVYVSTYKVSQYWMTRRREIKGMVITIDGLGVNGKSALASKISKQSGLKNFNTGAIKL